MPATDLKTAGDVAAPDTSIRPPRRHVGLVPRVAAFVTRYNTAFICLLLIVGASFFSDAFFTPRNVSNVLRQIAAVGIASMGMLLVILTRGINRSVGSVAAFGSVLSAHLIAQMGIGASVPVAILAGCGLGAISGALTAFRRMPPFVVTLGMLTIARGASLIVSKRAFTAARSRPRPTRSAACSAPRCWPASPSACSRTSPPRWNNSSGSTGRFCLILLGRNATRN